MSAAESRQSSAHDARIPRLALAGSLLVTALLPLVVAPSAHAADPCVAISSLVDKGHPQLAITTIDELNAPLGGADKLCLAERSAAVAMMVASENSALDAEALAAEWAELPERTYTELVVKLDTRTRAIKAAELALEGDRNNQRAPDILKALKPDARVGEACRIAASLTDSGFPQRAIDALDAAEGTGVERCAPQREQALQAKATSEAQVVHARTLLAVAGQLPDKTTQELAARHDLETQAMESAENARKADRENQQARELLDELRPGFWAGVPQGWDDFSKTFTVPAATFALTAAGLAAGLLLLARVFAAAPPWWKRKTSAAEARRRLVSGWILVAAGSVGLVASIAGVNGLTIAERRAFIGLSALVAGLGVFFTAWGTATKLRVGVSVLSGGKEDPHQSAHVLGLLERFGASPPRGLERPAGPDVQVLKDVLAEVAEGWMGKVAKAISAFLGWTPWKVAVSSPAEKGVTAVTITRNGRLFDSLLLKPDDVTVKGSPTEVDPAVLVAAFVITTLDRAHEGFEGLCGATHWRSIGFQYAASGLKAEEALPLLKDARSKDPDNWLAAVDLKHRQLRHATAAADLEAYDEWLTRSIARISGSKEPEACQEDWKKDPAPSSGYLPLVIRMRVTQAVCRINLTFASSQKDHPTHFKNARDAIVQLCRSLDHPEIARAVPTDSRWLAAQRSMAASLALSVRVKPTRDDQKRVDPKQDESEHQNEQVLDDAVTSWGSSLRWGRLRPLVHYSLACAYATPTLDARKLDHKQLPEIVAELREATLDPEIATWLPLDPQLAEFRKLPEYNEFRPTPATDLLAHAPFAKYRTELEKRGLDSPRRLADMEPPVLARLLDIVEPAAQELTEASEVHESLQSYLSPDALKAWQPIVVEAVAELLRRQSASCAHLAQLDAQSATALVKELVERARTFRGFTGIGSSEPFSGWLAGLNKETPEGQTP